MNFKLVFPAFGLLSVFATGAAFSAPLQPIPKESGFGGFITLGASATQFSSNTVSGTDMGDVAQENIDSLDEGPDSESDVSGFFTGELTYTFAESRTQLFFGNSLEDLVRYDFTFQAGARQELAGNGIVYGAFLFSAIPTSVYADPYQTGVDRDETDRNSNGGRIGWQGIGGSNFGVELSHRTIELDDEESGQAFVDGGGLTTDEQDLLNREGSQTNVKLSYIHTLSPGNLLVPAIQYVNFDLDGEAMAGDRVGGELAYIRNTQQYSLIVTMSYSHRNHDEENPIWSEEEEVDNFGGSIVGTYHAPFGWKGWSAVASVAAGESDSDINFYDADIITGSVGMLYRF
ncbi:DUF2860 family protein [Litoribacillus peritrichatus]|uniref:DUF2860 family protein n=1 Tax=Litoribacillus peritrichatus TaxID=718191 RepID=A0ABP7MU14_9GAMM